MIGWALFLVAAFVVFVAVLIIGFVLGVAVESANKSKESMRKLFDSSIKELEEGQELEMFATISKKRSDCECCDILNPDNVQVDFRMN